VLSGERGRQHRNPGRHDFRPLQGVRAELAAGTVDQARLADELGDVLFAVANLARHCKVDPEAALRATNDKFERRFRHIEKRLAEAGRKPADATLEEMEALWQEAKTKA